MDEEQKEEQPILTETERKEMFLKSLLAALAKYPGAPSREQLEGWKEVYEVFALGPNEEEIYLWRPVTRLEYKNIKRDLLEKQQKENKPVEDGVFEEAIVQNCLLWCSQPDAIHKKGGTADLLFEQIMLNSNFINTQTAAQMVFKL